MTTRFHHAVIALALLTFLNCNAHFSTVCAQGTAFTYQGQLQANNSPANGSFDLTFTLFNTGTGGAAALAGPVTNAAVMVTNGLFTVTIDFGPGAFTGQTNWLEIGVATNGSGSFTTLAPRQQLTAAPYAIHAESAGGLSGTLTASQLTSLGNTNGGVGNFFVGAAGNPATGGSSNTANGVSALAANQGGSGNTAEGYGALGNSQGDSYNIALGYMAGIAINGGSSNIDIGNPGVNTDAGVIRIGGGQSQAFIAGVINGNGAGLTNLETLTLTAATNLVLNWNGSIQKFLITNTPDFYLTWGAGWGDASFFFTQSNNLHGSLFNNPAVLWVGGSNNIVTNTAILSVSSFGTNFIRAALAQP